MTGWREHKIGGQAERRDYAATLKAALAVPSLFQDIDWLGARCDAPGKSVLLLIKGPEERPEGAAPVVVQRSEIEFQFGELTVFRKKVRRYLLDAGPILSGGHTQEDVLSCFAALRGALARGGVVYLQGVPAAGALHALLEDRTSGIHRQFRVLAYGRGYTRCRILWDGTVEGYFASLAPRTAKDLKRTWRKFTDDFAGAFETRRYTGPDEVSDFLAAAVTVSERTYQRKVLDRGLSLEGGDEAELRAGAERGYFTGYVLFARGEPVAFDYGYHYGDGFFLIQKGYDPNWKEHKVGMVLGCEILRDLETRKVKLRMLDYMYGDNIYKIRTSNHKTEERNYYLFPRTAGGFALAASLSLTVRLSEGIGRFLEKHGLKDRIKRLIRRSGA